MNPIRIHAFLHPKACPVSENPANDYHLVPPAWIAIALKRFGHKVTWGPEPTTDYDVALISDVGSWGEPHPDKPVLYYLDDAGLTPRGDVPKNWINIADNRATFEQQRDKGYASYLTWPGFDPEVFYPIGLDRDIKIGFRGRPDEGTHYKGRQRLLEELRKNPNFVESHSGDCENWNQGGKQWTYAKLNAWRNRVRVYALHTFDGEKGYSPHLVEALASGCHIIHNSTRGTMERFVGHGDLRMWTLGDGQFNYANTIADWEFDDAKALRQHEWLIANGHTWQTQAEIVEAAMRTEGIV